MMNVYFVLGPTAVGKSQFAIEAAEAVGGVIVNADSLQFYKGLSIGSAAPSDHDFKRVPHKLFHCLDWPQEVSAGWFYKIMTDTLAELEHQGVKHVFAVGGSGFYLEILERGLLPVGGESYLIRQELEAKLKEQGNILLYQELVTLDPNWAKKIKPQDSYRIVRALETIKVSGRILTDLYIEWNATRLPFKYPLKKIGLTASREWIIERVKKRTHQIVTGGILEEVKAFDVKPDQVWAPLRSVGYKEALQFNRGEIKTYAELEEAIVKSTMRLIKKQKTWFKRDKQINWLYPERIAQPLTWAIENKFIPRL